MTWKNLLETKRLAVEPTSKAEFDELRAMVEVNLKDAQVSAVSAQGRYEFAYNAARLLATIVLRASGYRVIAKTGHHFYTFHCLSAADPSFKTMADYFEVAREKRNDFSYSSPAALSDTDAQDLIDVAIEFAADVERWVSKKFPPLGK
jgi:hypothetical protein